MILLSQIVVLYIVRHFSFIVDPIYLGEDFFIDDDRSLILSLMSHNLILLLSTAIMYAAVSIFWFSFFGIPPFSSVRSQEGDESGTGFVEHIGSLPENRALQIADLRKRANGLTRTSNTVLVSIVVLLISAAVFIVFAGSIATLDASGANLVQQAQAIRDSVQARLDEAQETQVELHRVRTALEEVGERLAAVSPEMSTDQRARALGLILAETALQPESGPYISQFTQYVNSGPAEGPLRTYLNEVVVAIGSLLKVKTAANLAQIEINKRDQQLFEIDLDTARTSLSSAIERSQATGGSPGITSDRLLIAAAVTRFGILAIAIYLVQILVSLYRYNTTAASYYRSKADALVLFDHPATEIDELSTALRPDLDFGKSPKALPEKAWDRLETAFETAFNRAFGRVTQPASASGSPPPTGP